MKNKPLQKLIAAARKAEPSAAAERETKPPFGFATRVAALWTERPMERTLLFEKLAWRGLVCAALICATTAVARKSAASGQDIVEAESVQMVEEELELF